MNVRKIIGRLNCQTQHFEMGRGGIPELTPQDIAAAVGMVQDVFAREIFCAVWWPDGGALTVSQLGHVMLQAVLGEYVKRAREHSIVRLDLEIAQGNYAAKRAHSERDSRELSKLRSIAARKREECWPSQMEVFPAICSAVLSEMQSPRHCPECQGRGEVMDGALMSQCKVCEGSGSGKASDRSRAIRIGRDEAAYRRTWRPVFEWVYALATEKEKKAGEDLATALSRNPIAA